MKNIGNYASRLSSFVFGMSSKRVTISPLYLKHGAWENIYDSVRIECSVELFSKSTNAII